MKRLILVPNGDSFQVALAVYYDKGRFRIEARHDQLQTYHDAMATLSRLKRNAKAAIEKPMSSA